MAALPARRASALVALILAGCGIPGRMSPAERALEARRDALEMYLAAMDPDPAATTPGAAAAPAGPLTDSSAALPDSSAALPGSSAALTDSSAALTDSSAADRPLVPFDDVLIVVRRPMIETLIAATLPFESVLDGRYRVRVESATVTPRTGIALVELRGRASLVDQPGVFADVTLIGALDIATTAAAGEGAVPSLSGRVEIFGVDTRELRVATLSPPVERLLDGLARLRVNELNRILGDIPVPIRLVERLDLPGVDENEVTIPAAGLDAVFRLVAVRVMEEGIFVSLGVDRSNETWRSVPITSLPGVGR